MGGLVPFIGLLSGFVALSFYLGGGSIGVALAILVSAVYLLFYGIYLYLSDKRKTLPEPARAEIPTGAMVAGRDTARSPSVATPEKDVPREAMTPPRVAPPAPTQPRRPRKPRAVPPPHIDEDDVCPIGPYEVEAGAPVKIELDVAEGQMVKGLLEEEDGYDFDWLVVDEDGWVEFRQSRPYPLQVEGHDEATYKVEWLVPEQGPWFLVLDAYGRQYTRYVEVRLRKEGPGTVRRRQ